MHSLPGWTRLTNSPAATRRPSEPPRPARARKGRSRTSPLQRIVQAALTLLLLYLIFGVVLPQIADWSDVWDAIQELSGLDVAPARSHSSS